MGTLEYLKWAAPPHQRYHAVAITGLRYTLAFLPLVTVPSFHESVDFNATVIKAVYNFADGLLPCTRSLFNTGLAGQGTPPTGLSR